MDYRTKSFLDKFKDAQKFLHANSIQDIISLKFRDNVNYSEYSRFIDYIRHDLRLDARSIDGNLQGQAWLITDKEQNNIILVEHETGLEILAIAGSIASLIGLLPLLNSGWKFFMDKYWHRPYLRGGGNNVELRKFDSNGLLIEQEISSIENYILNINFEENKNLVGKVAKLEQKIKKLERELSEKSKKSKKLPKTQRKLPKPQT